MIKPSLAGWVAAGLACASLAHAQQYDRPYDQPYDQSGYGVSTLDERVARLEKRLSGDALAEMANRTERLQSEVLKLRGTVEELTHSLDKLKKQQRDMYGELDQRLDKAESAVPVAPVPPVAVPPAGTAPGIDPNAPPVAPAAPAAPPPDAAAATPPPAAVAPPPPPPAPVVDPAARAAAYQKAFNTLKEGKYTEAIRDFKNYVAAYPGGENADSAYYWLAEAYYVNRDFNSARDTFRKVARDFPKSAKLPDAHLKLGFIEYENGQYAAARDLLGDVVKRFPDSSAAKMAEKRLERMRQEKH
jgi:tol-pal system protein YbgF